MGQIHGTAGLVDETPGQIHETFGQIHLADGLVDETRTPGDETARQVDLINGGVDEIISRDDVVRGSDDGWIFLVDGSL